MLADGEVNALNEGGVDLPTRWGQHVFDARQVPNTTRWLT